MPAESVTLLLAHYRKLILCAINRVTECELKEDFLFFSHVDFYI